MQHNLEWFDEYLFQTPPAVERGEIGNTEHASMNLAGISVAALVLAIVVSCVTTLNVGVLAIALAWIVGVYFGGMPVAAVMGGFPRSCS